MAVIVESYGGGSREKLRRYKSICIERLWYRGWLRKVDIELCSDQSSNRPDDSGMERRSCNSRKWPSKLPESRRCEIQYSKYNK